MRLPCWALIDGGALNCQYITTFLSNSKFNVVLTASLHCHRCPSLSIASMPSPSPLPWTLPSTLPSSIAPSPLPTTASSSTTTSSSPSPSTITVVIYPRHRHRRRRPSLPSPSSSSSLSSVAPWPSPSSLTVICARCAVKGGIVVIVLCLSAYSASLPHHSHPLFFDCYVKKSCPRSRRIPTKPH